MYPWSATIYVAKPTRRSCGLCGKQGVDQDGCSHVECPCRKPWTALPDDPLSKVCAILERLNRER